MAQARAHLLVADRETGDTVRARGSFVRGRPRPGHPVRGRGSDPAGAAGRRPGVHGHRRDRGAGRVGALGHLDSIARVAALAAPEVAAVLRTAQVQGEIVAAARTRSAAGLRGRFLARYVRGQGPREHRHRARHPVPGAVPDTHVAPERGVPQRPPRRGRRGDPAGRAGRDGTVRRRDPHHPPTTADALTLLAERVCAGTRPLRAAGGDAAAGGVSDQALAQVVDGSAGTRLSGTVPRPHLSLIVPAETVAEA